MYLAQQGFTVDVFERRPALPKDKPLAVGPRSFCIMLHRRCVRAAARLLLTGLALIVQWQQQQVQCHYCSLLLLTSLSVLLPV